jgi:hypothetical protein
MPYTFINGLSDDPSTTALLLKHFNPYTPG